MCPWPCAHYVFSLVQVRNECSTFEWRLVGSCDDNIKVAEVVFMGGGADAGSRVSHQALCFLLSGFPRGRYLACTQESQLDA